MKKIKTMLLLAAATLGLASCGEKPCSHVDENKDHKCDLCSVDMGEHKDDDGDGKCEYCNQNIPSVKSVEITGIPEKFVVGDSVQLSATVTGVGGAATTVTWKTDNNNVATITSGGFLEAKGAGTVTVTATSTQDSTKTATVTISVEAKNWPQAELTMMTTYFGEAFPYVDGEFVWTDEYFEEYGCLTAESTKLGDADVAIATLKGLNSWTAGPDESMAEFAKPLSSDPTKVLYAMIYVDENSVSTIDLYLYEANWPTNVINQFLGEGATETVLAPASALCYQTNIYEDEIDIIVNGSDVDAYLNDLETAGYVIDDSLYEDYYDYYGFGYYKVKSPLATISLGIFDYPGYFGVAIKKVATEWTQDEKDLMTELIGEVLPFFSGIEYWDEYYGELEGQIESEDAVAGIIDVLEDNGWTGGWDNDEYEYIFTKGTLKAEIYSWYGTYYIDFSVSSPLPEILTDWPAQDIAEALGEKAKSTLPECEGTGYEFSSYTDGCEVFVYDGVLEDYIQVLEGQGYTIQKQTAAVTELLSGDGTIFVRIYEYADGIQIIALAQSAPEGSTEWPTAAINEFLGFEHVVPAPATFTKLECGVGKDGEYDAYCIHVFGSDFDAYVTLLNSSGFTADSMSGGKVDYAMSNDYQVWLTLEYISDSEFIIKVSTM